MKTFLRFISIMLLLISVNACTGRANLLPLSSTQIDSIVQKEQWDLLQVQNVGNIMTGIIYQRPPEAGCYIGWNDQNVNTSGGTSFIWYSTKELFDPTYDIRNENLIAFRHWVFDRQVICLLINDSLIRQRATEINTTFSDGSTLRTKYQGQQGVFITRKTSQPSFQFESVIFYDANGNILFTIEPGLRSYGVLP